MKNKTQINPFLNGNPIWTKDISVYNKQIDTLKDGTTEQVSVKRTREIEIYNATRVYRNKKNSELIYQMDPAGLRLYLYIIFNLGHEKDRIELRESKVCDDIKKSSKTFRRGIKELRKYNIISKYYGRKNMWYINPNHFFYGEKLKVLRGLYGEDVVKNKKINDEF